jgi:hypothetical protein
MVMDIQAIIHTRIPILITDTTGRITADEVFIGPTGAAFITRVIAIGDNLNRSNFSVSWGGTFLAQLSSFPERGSASTLGAKLLARDPGYFFGDVGGFTLTGGEP